jgi:hypothetical protein
MRTLRPTLKPDQIIERNKNQINYEEPHNGI